MLCEKSALADPAPRSFEKIVVIGNERWRDQDIIKTSKLEIETAIGIEEISEAVEALEYTGEFKSVRIKSSGPTLFIVVDEVSTATGNLSFGGGYNSDDGAYGLIQLRIDNAFNKKASISAETKVGEHAQFAQFDIQQNKLEHSLGVFGARLVFLNTNYDNSVFDLQEYSITPYFLHALGDNTKLEVRYSLSYNEIYNVAYKASDIIKSDDGSQISSGLGFSILYGKSISTRPENFEFNMALHQDFTGLGGDTKTSKTRFELNTYAPLSTSNFAVRTSVEAGAAVGIFGDDTRVTDRYSLGGSSLRGFEFGSVSPVDNCATCSSQEQSYLGGNFFTAVRTDLLVPLFDEKHNIETFVFADIGNSWGIDNKNSPSGVLVENGGWRASLGVGASYFTPYGRFEAYYAAKTFGQVYDRDQTFGITFRTN